MSTSDQQRPLPECVNEFKHIREVLDDIHKAVSGTNGTPGIKTDVYVLKQNEARRARYSHGTFVALAGLVIERAWSLLSGG